MGRSLTFDLAIKYLNIFVSGKNYERFDEVLDNKSFQFIGPLFMCDSARDYIDEMVRDPAVNTSYKIVQHESIKDNICDITFDIVRPEKEFRIDGFFESNGQKIIKICLDFDPKDA